MHGRGDDSGIHTVPKLRNCRQAFCDRAEAGRQLAGLVAEDLRDGTVVFGAAPGGVPVAAEIAGARGLPLEIAVCATLTPPWSDEPIYGAVAWDGSVHFDQALLEALSLGRKEIAAAVERAGLEVAARIQLYYGTGPAPQVADRDALLVSDGTVTAVGLEAAVAALRNAGAARVVLATATGTRRDLHRLAGAVDGAYCASLHVSYRFTAASAYSSLPEMDAEDAAALLWGGEGQSPGRSRIGPRRADAGSVSVTRVAARGAVAE